MSFILANIKRVLTEEAQDESTSPSLKDHNPFTFALPSAKLVNLIQPYYLDEKKQLSLLTDVETYLLKSQKMLYLKQIEYFLPGIIYWFKPESGLFIAIRHTVMKLSGETDPERIENIIDQNEGIFEYFLNFFNTNVNVFKFSLQKPTGLSLEMERNILYAMMEWLQYQNVPHIKNPVALSNLISGIFPVTLCPELDLHQTDCFTRHENREINFVNYHFFCFVCQQHFASSKEQLEHLKSHDKYVCNNCEADYEEYKDLASHKLTFCRGSNDKKCSFCLIPADNCSCVKYFKNTIDQIYGQLQKQPAEVSQFVTEGYQYFREVLMKPSHVIKNVELCQTDDPKLTPGIKSELWPKVSVIHDEEIWEIKGLNIYGNQIMFPELKKQSFSKYLSNYLQFDILKFPLLNYFRDACPVDKCNFIVDKAHYFTTHLRCPVASRMANEEVPLLYKPDEFVDHLTTHLEQIWFFNGEKLVCTICNFTTLQQGKLSLSIMTEHAFQHKNTRFEEKCLNVNSQICNDLRYNCLQDFTFHLLTFHFKNEKEFRDNLVQILHFKILLEEEKLENNSLICGTPKSRIPKNPSKNLFELKYNLLHDSQSTQQPSIESTVAKSSEKQPEFVNDKPQMYSSDKDNCHMKTNIDPNPPCNNEGKYECKNENHESPLQFKSAEHKQYHILKSHSCIAPHCQYSNEFESELLKHYELIHAKTKNICQLCGMGFNNKQEHYDSYHFACTACKEWFATLNDLKSHEITCFKVTEKDPVDRVTTTSLVNNSVDKDSLMIDQTNTETNFSKALLGILDLVSSNLNLPEEVKLEYERSIRKQASENLITKSRLRAENFSNFKSQELLLDEPKWFESTGKDAVSKIQTVLGEIKESDVFKASTKNSHKFAIANFECLDAIQKRISRVTCICSLSEPHGKILLSNFLSDSVKDEICGYNKTADLLDLSYLRILQTLQFLYINIKLQILESRIMSYRIQEDETIYQFSNRCQKHLSLCSRKLDVSHRAAYIENNLAKLLRGNVPSKVLAEIHRKESVFSPYTSQEILDIFKNIMKEDDNLEQYEVLYTQKDYSPKSKFRTKSRNGQMRKQSYMTESSKNRFKELGLDPSTSPILCFLCLEEGHVSSKCPTYPNTSLSSILCRVDGEPHGYHHHDMCIHQDKVYCVDSSDNE